MTRLNLGVLVSGNGTNLQAILDAASSGRLPAEVRVVISNRKGVLALDRAARANVPALCIPHDAFPDRDTFDAAVAEALVAAKCDWIVLAGFMRVLTPGFLERFKNRVLNIHPALLPAFPGTRAIRQALNYGVTLTGCTVHLVDNGVDTGPILAQRAVPVLAEDTEQSLGARLHEAEHQLLVDTLIALAVGQLTPEEAVARRRQ